MTAVPLIFGRLTADDYEDDVAGDPRIDALRGKMEVVENKQFSKDYLDPDKRSIGNAVQVFFNDGSKTEKVSVDYPIGHRRRRAEGIPELKKKFAHNLALKVAPKNAQRIHGIVEEQSATEKTSVNDFVDLFLV